MLLLLLSLLKFSYPPEVLADISNENNSQGIVLQTPYGQVPLPSAKLESSTEMGPNYGVIYYKNIVEDYPNFTITHKDLQSGEFGFITKVRKRKHLENIELLRIEVSEEGQKRCFLFEVTSGEEARFQKKYGQWDEVEKKVGQWQWSEIPPPGEYGFMIGASSNRIYLFNLVEELPEE